LVGNNRQHGFNQIREVAMSDDDVGCISKLEMDIKMTSDQPVQKSYLSIPRPLYPEVKGYIKDLLNRGFIRKSTSPFSSSVVCVRKKDGGMRLCIDYRELNKKTVPDRHPMNAPARSHAEYVTKWKTAMQEAYSLASKSAMKSAIRGKRNYDRRVRSSALQVGYRVLARNLTPCGGPGKLRAFWEDEIHVVNARKGEGSPVYDVRPESGQGRSRTLHRNLLLPCDQLPSKQ